MNNKLSNDQSEWMRLSEAADYIGVHFTTLRRWSDAGEMPCFKTPGGRRRFRKSDLDAFLQQIQENPQDKLKTLFTESGKPEIVREIQALNLHDASWYGQISQENRRQMAKHGRNLIGTLMQYAGRSEGGELYLQQGKKLAESYGELCQQSGFSMIQTVQTFVMIRNSIVDSLCEAGIVVKDSGEETWKIYQRVNNFLDIIMLTILDSFQADAHSVPHSLG